MQTGNQMGAFLENITSASRNIKKIIQQKKSLQVRSIGTKRAPFRLSVGIRAFVSMEASIAIPIFLFCFLEIMSLLNYISVYSGVLYAMKTTADPICIYGYAYDQIMEEKSISLGEQVVSSFVFSETYLDSQIRTKCADHLFEHVIENGAEGISLLGSYVDREESEVSVIAQYTMKPLFSFAGTELSVVSGYCGRMWTGYTLEQEDSETEYVYITKTGSVYHLTDACTYLKPSVKSIKADELEQKRNESGAIYKPCSVCCEKETKQSTYYITDYGDRYHTKTSCTKLRRTTYRVEKSKVKGLSACKKCSEKDA